MSRGEDTEKFEVTGSDRCLVVIADGAATTHSLPQEGAVLIGRSEEAEIQVSHGSVSREHARLRVGEKILIEDLGSSNGTRVDGRTLSVGDLEEIDVDEAVELGGAMIVIQQVSLEDRPGRVCSHDDLVADLNDACAAGRHGFALMRVQVQAGMRPAVMRAALAGNLRREDRIAEYGANDYEILLQVREASEASEVASRLTAALERAGVIFRDGIALYPEDGDNPSVLMTVAETRVRSGVSAELIEGRIVVKSAPMVDLFRLAERAAQSMVGLVILGETGVGKDVLAAHVHRCSPRAGGVFLKLNCAALAETLLESELFGHERGAFTGAVRQKTGLLQSGHGGTVLLDEIGELPMPIQAKLLRALEEKEILPVGAIEPRAIDVRFVAATNRDLEADVERGTFRRDLFFRLNGMTLTVPPLRERADEIEPLAYLFLSNVCQRQGIRSPPTISDEAMALLKSHGWPGNVRELRNVVERAVVLSGGGEIGLEVLPDELTQPQVEPAFASRVTSRQPTEILPTIDLRSEIENIERQRIVEALEQCEGNQSKVAKLLGISRSMLLRRLDRYNLRWPRKRPGSEAK